VPKADDGLLAQSFRSKQKHFALCASHFSLNGKEALFNSRRAGQSNQKKAALTMRPAIKPPGPQAGQEFP
jgi:type IV secretory pathway VirD2 relaxase